MGESGMPNHSSISIIFDNLVWKVDKLRFYKFQPSYKLIWVTFISIIGSATSTFAPSTNITISLCIIVEPTSFVPWLLFSCPSVTNTFYVDYRKLSFIAGPLICMDRDYGFHMNKIDARQQTRSIFLKDHDTIVSLKKFEVCELFCTPSSPV